MNERTLAAIQACEKSAAAIAKRHGWDEPHFFLPHSDYEIEFWRAAEGLSGFLAKVAKADKPSAQVVGEKAKAPPTPLPIPLPVRVPDLPVNEREEKASELTVDIDDKPAANFADVVGIGKDNQSALYSAGYFTWEDILQAGINKIREDVPSIGASRVRALFTRAQRDAG